MTAYKTIEQMIELIDEPNRSNCNKMLADNQALFQTAHGSVHNHQAWQGGYYDHIQEIMNIGCALYETLNSLRKLPFSLSDALLIDFLHDVEKPWKYEQGEDGELRHTAAFQTKKADHEFRMQKLREYNIKLTPEQENAFKYVEGELNDYSNKKRVTGPLGAFCHLCDVTSARIWFNHPLAEKDEWKGARRIRDTK